MQFVVDSVRKICKGLVKGVTVLVSGIGKIPDAGCFYCCKYFGKMSDGLGSIIGSYCKRPYTCCATITLMLIATPLVWGVIGLLDARKLDCDVPTQPGLLISILCHAINLLFISYLVTKYGKKRKSKKKNVISEAQSEALDKSVDITQIPTKDQTIINTNRKRSSSQNEIKTEKKNLHFDPETGVSAQVPEGEDKDAEVIPEAHEEYDSVLAKFAKR